MAPDWVVLLLMMVTLTLSVISWRWLDRLARRDGPVLAPLLLTMLCLASAAMVLALAFG